MPYMTDSEQRDVRKFIGRVVSWPEPGEEAYINFHSTYKGKKWKETKDTDKPKLDLGSAGFAKSVDEAFNVIMSDYARDDTFDLYLCLSTQHKTKMIKWGNGHLEVAHRDLDNTLRLKAFYLDVDIYKGYETETKAQAAISKFVLDAGLPDPSIMVHSGGGYHVYWVLDKPVNRDEWCQVADALKIATDRFGLVTDPGVTGDACHVLRVPCTLNYKNLVDASKTITKPRPVSLYRFEAQEYGIDEIKGPLSQFMGLAPKRNVTSKVTFGLEVLQGHKPFTTDMDDALDPDMINPKDAAKACNFIATTMKAGGANLSSQTSWMHATHLATFMDKGREIAHMMAEKSQYYIADHTDNMFDRKSADKAKGVGWLKCGTIAGELDAKPICAACPHRDKGKFPFSFIGETPEQELINSLVTYLPPINKGFTQEIGPPNYRRDTMTKLWGIKKDDKWVTPTETKLGHAYVTHNPTLTMHVQVNINDWATPFELSIDAGTIYGSHQELGKFLGSAGVDARTPKPLKDMFMAWLETLKHNRSTFSQHEPYGWAFGPDGRVIGFAYNKVVYTKTEPMRVSGGDRSVLDRFKSLGDLEEWKLAAKGITSTRRPGIDAIIAAQFAAPLMKFVGESVYINIYSVDSGVGKTTAMSVAQAVWSKPIASQGINDTNNAVNAVAETLRNLPVNWDDLRGHDYKKKISEMAFQFTSGRGKARMKQDRTLAEVGSWRSILLTTSNERMQEAVEDETKGTEAGYLRVLELEVPKVSFIHDGEGDEIKKVTELNYGVAGELYAQWLGAHYDEIEEEVTAVKKEFGHALKAVPDERFWMATAVGLYLGAKYSRELGLTNIDVDGLKKALFDRIEYMRGARLEKPQKSNTVEFALGLIGIYLSYIRPQVIITNMIFLARGKPSKGQVVQRFADNDRGAREAPLAQIGLDHGLLRMDRSNFEKWIKKEFEINPKQIIDTLVAAGARTQKASLGAGLDYKETSRNPVIDLDYTKYPELDNMMNQVTVSNVTHINKATGFNTP